VPALRPGPGEDRLCGGCEWLHLRYELQLREKGKALAEAFRRIGRMEPGSYPMLPVLPSPAPLRYRSRARFHLGRSGDHLVSTAAARTSRCGSGSATCSSRGWITCGRRWAGARPGPPPPHRDRARVVRARRAGAALLRGLDAGEATRRRADELVATLPLLAGIVVEGEGDGRRGRPATLHGDPVLHHERVPGDPARGLARSRPDVFQQANRGANARLVDAALRMLAPDGEEVLELFCGAGNFTGPLAVRAASVSAVEGQGPALEIARGDLSGRNVRFFAGDALALAGALARERRRFGCVLLDPPRDG